MSGGVGTLAWARRTHGRLSRRDRVALLLQGMRRSLPRGSRLGATLELDAYEPPDTPAAREAEELCREASSPALTAHCYRCHLWGVAIAGEQGLSYDEEAFYVACLTHDLGLTERFRGHDPEAACFSLDSASAARDLVERHGWAGRRPDGVAEAITLHLNAHVSLSQGAEAHLLQLGAALDVTGYRLGDVERATRAAILERHPRLGMKEEFVALMDQEVRVHPDSRPAFFTKRVGFKRMIHRAPFDS
jgi:predicted HD phosphohydrolase